ncbi:MAG: S8 family serine peptidase [Ardenticatenales bacterium]
MTGLPTTLRPDDASPRRWRGLSAAIALSIVLLSLPLSAAAQHAPPPAGVDAPAQGGHGNADSTFLDAAAAERAALADDPAASHRVIVQLSEPALAEWAAAGAVPRSVAYDAEGLLDEASPAARAQLARIDAQQQAFLGALPKAVPSARLATFVDEYSRSRPLRYRIVLNGLAIDAGLDADVAALEASLRAMPGVLRVGRDWSHQPTMYDSLKVIHAADAWDNAAVGGVANAGAGVRAASMDGGIHKDAPMFSGAGYTMPVGFPIGYVENTNGKIIASRVYFRSWDPPQPGDDTSWPGAYGTPHGVHTSGTMGGNQVEALYPGADVPVTISGVAPRAYLMSYRVFYQSVNGIGSFYNAEGIQALEDLVRDRAMVVNNSWGGGPGSVGGEFDALDTALINATRAGVFVSMANGNAGPGPGTGDHPSDDYINVAATTKGSLYVSGGVDVTAPEPVSATLKGMAYGTASFGGTLPTGQRVGPFSWKPASVISATNGTGCQPFPAGSFAGGAALIERGTCNFSIKAANGQAAGATMVIIYNHAAGGDGAFGMSGGDRADEVTVPTISVGHANGLALAAWQMAHGAAAKLEIDTVAHLWRSTEHPGDVTPPDHVAGFSSRGPSSAGTLKPDIAAPGVDIMSQGYAPGGGEGRHMGYGQAGGTSMAAPHVAGAAVMIRQIHMDWSPAMIKSALMSTSQYTNVWVDAKPAQPLDIGAGRLDLAHAADPGVILSPPSLSFGYMGQSGTKSIEIELRSVASAAETYAVTTVDTSGGFDSPPAVAGMTVSPASVTVPQGGTAKLTVTWSAIGHPIGDAQGYVVLTGAQHTAHLPAWMRVMSPPAADEVLVIDADGSMADDPEAPADYAHVYTETLEAMNVSYTVHDTAPITQGLRIPTAAELGAYKWLIIETGDNGGELGIGGIEQNNLLEYTAAGGWVAVFGQDAAAVLGSANPDGGTSFYGTALGATWQKDSVNAGKVMTTTQQILTGAPGSAYNNLAVDVSATGDGAGNQVSIDEIKFDTASGAMPLLRYAMGGAFNDQGFVGGALRNDPTVDVPGRFYRGRSAYFGFGLEGVNDDTGHASRQDILASVRSWLSSDVKLAVTPQVRGAHRQSYFTATLTAADIDTAPEGASIDAGVRYRATFGDGSGIHETTKRIDVNGTAVMGHVWDRPGRYHVVIEGRGSYGITSVWQMDVDVPVGAEFHDWDPIYLPISVKGDLFPATP